MAGAHAHRSLPGFGLSLGFTLAYLSLIVLVPLAAVFLKTSGMSAASFWQAVASPRVLASYRLSFGASLLAAAINTVFGFLLAWSLVGVWCWFVLAHNTRRLLCLDLRLISSTNSRARNPDQFALWNAQSV